MRTDENMNLLDELVLSQKTHHSLTILQFFNYRKSYAGCAYQFLFISKQFLQSYNKKFQESGLL